MLVQELVQELGQEPVWATLLGRVLGPMLRAPAREWRGRRQEFHSAAWRWVGPRGLDVVTRSWCSPRVASQVHLSR